MMEHGDGFEDSGTRATGSLLSAPNPTDCHLRWRGPHGDRRPRRSPLTTGTPARRPRGHRRRRGWNSSISPPRAFHRGQDDVRSGPTRRRVGLCTERQTRIVKTARRSERAEFLLANALWPVGTCAYILDERDSRPAAGGGRPGRSDGRGRRIRRERQGTLPAGWDLDHGGCSATSAPRDRRSLPATASGRAGRPVGRDFETRPSRGSG